MNEFTRVLVPVDGSPASERALLRAIAIAADQRAEIHFVHVIQSAQEQASFDDAQHAMHVVGDSLLDHAVALACEQDLLGSSAVLVTNERRRSIAQQILCAADAVAADLIVCGAHGTGSRTSLPHGSVADELVACCRVSLMLEHELPLTQAEAVAQGNDQLHQPSQPRESRRKSDEQVGPDHWRYARHRRGHRVSPET